MVDGVPADHRQAAEEIRAHLVSLRGGAPFLSPTDATLLVDWLDAAIPVPTILTALERAADLRRKRRSKVPLCLKHAKRHLGKRSKAHPTPAPATGHPLSPLGNVFEPDDQVATCLLKSLVELDPSDPDQLVREACALVRHFFRDLWQGLTASEREALLQQGRALYADLEDLDESVLGPAAEEAARDLLRARYPALSASTLWELAHR